MVKISERKTAIAPHTTPPSGPKKRGTDAESRRRIGGLAPAAEPRPGPSRPLRPARRRDAPAPAPRSAREPARTGGNRLSGLRHSAPRGRQQGHVSTLRLLGAPAARPRLIRLPLPATQRPAPACLQGSRGSFV